MAVVERCQAQGYSADPRTIICDFEAAAMKAVPAALGENVRVQGCFYHLCQSTWRKLQELGLATAYKERNDVRHFVGTEPLVDALHLWSGFSKKGAWGQVTSSWAAQFINVCDRFGGQAQALPIVEAFFAGDDVLTATQPRLHPVTLGNVTHLYQRRATCCRYYLLPQGSLCASCPLVSQEERIQRNLDWMRKQLQVRKEPAQS